MLREAGAEHGKALIVNTASIAGKAGQGWLAVYSATKAGVIGLSQAIQMEVGNAGIQVTALCPAFVDTPMTEWVQGQVKPEEMIRPEDLAETVRLLLRDLAGLPDPGDRLHPSGRELLRRLRERGRGALEAEAQASPRARAMRRPDRDRRASGWGTEPRRGAIARRRRGGRGRRGRCARERGPGRARSSRTRLTRAGRRVRISRGSPAGAAGRRCSCPSCARSWPG